MNAEIIAVGSELLTPSRIDTNSLFLTAELNDLGVEVAGKMVIGDDVARLTEAVRGVMTRSGIAILSGGLGPTEDDVTREAVARALARELVFRDDIRDEIEQRFRRMGRKMAEINTRQANVIQGAEVLPNDNGTAPGQWIEDSGRVVILLPGPPNELKPMFTAQCRPRLERIVPRRSIRSLVFRVAGMPESDLDQLISPVYRKYANPATTILAAPGDIQVHLRAQCETEAEAAALLAEVGGQIEALLGDRIYSRNGDALEAVVGARLRELGATLSVAESCTGGLLAERITQVPGSSDYFLGGVVVYTSRVKSELLGVDAALIERETAVSPRVAESLAEGVRRLTGSTYALSVTGVAGPSGGTEAIPVGTVYVGLAQPGGRQARHYRFLGERGRVRALAAHYALDLLRRALT